MERQCNTHSTSVASKTRCRAFRSCCQRSSRLPDSSTSPRSRHVELRCSPKPVDFYFRSTSFPSVSTAPSVLRFLLIHPPKKFARCTQCGSLSSPLYPFVAATRTRRCLCRRCRRSDWRPLRCALLHHFARWVRVRSVKQTTPPALGFDRRR